MSDESTYTPEGIELAEDVDTSVEWLSSMLEDTDKMETPFGKMTAGELIQLVRPMAYQYVSQRPAQTMEVLSIIHMATHDVLDKHAERDPQEIATQARKSLTNNGD